MREEFLVIGIILIVVGVIFIPVSQLSGERKEQDIQTVASFNGQFARQQEVYLEGNKKYEIRWSGTIGENTLLPELEIIDPHGNTLYSTDSTNGIQTEFWGSSSGYYTINFNFMKFDDTQVTIHKYIETLKTAYPYHILFYIGLLLVTLGGTIMIVGTIISSKKLTT